MADAALTNEFVSAALAYVDLGYHPIPLRRPINPADKPTPPAGITGRAGRYLTRGALKIEVAKPSVVGLALRMSPDLVGIDVDVYRGGGETFLNLTGSLGELPPTCVTHSNRGDGSGIRLYRVPVGTALVGSIPGIEICQHWHRYCIVQPSRHPEGRDYGWIDEEERAAVPLPWSFEDLPALPWAWIDELRGRGPGGGYAATSVEVIDFIEAHTTGTRTELLDLVIDDASARVLAKLSRHDTLARALPWAMRDARAGMYPARLAIDTIEAWWHRAFALGDGRVQPDPGEFDRILLFAIGAALHETEADITERAERVLDEFERTPIDVTLANALARIEAMVEQSSYHPVDLTTYLSGDYEAVVPDLMMLPGEEGGEPMGLLYSQRLNEMHGDSGTGKSFAVAYCVREAAQAGRTTLVIDLEDTVVPLIQRLRQIGMSTTLIERHLVFIHPHEEWTPMNVGIVIDTITRRGVHHVFIDSLGEAFGVDGVSENADDEVTPWLRRVPRRIIDSTGVGVTLIDHITKAAENPLHPSGSKRKRAAITGASWFVYAIDAYTKDRGGRVRFMNGKDRHGNYKRGDDVADLVMEVVGPMCRMHIEAIAPPSPEAEVNFEHELQRLAVVAAEKYRPDSVPKKALLAAMREIGAKGRDDRFRGAIELAVLRGFLVENTGARGAQLYRYVRDWEPMGADEWLGRGQP